MCVCIMSIPMQLPMYQTLVLFLKILSGIIKEGRVNSYVQHKKIEVEKDRKIYSTVVTYICFMTILKKSIKGGRWINKVVRILLLPILETNSLMVREMSKKICDSGGFSTSDLELGGIPRLDIFQCTVFVWKNELKSRA